MQTAGNAATNPLQCLQSHPHSLRLTQNIIVLRWPRFQKPGFRKHGSNIDIHASLAVVTFVFISTLVSTLCNLLNLHLADHKVDDFPFSIQSVILYALQKLMLCFRSAMLVRSFTVKKISGTRHQPLLHGIRNLFVFVEYCHLLELCQKC